MAEKDPGFCSEAELRTSFLKTATADLWAQRPSFDHERFVEERSWSDGRADAVWAGVIGELLPDSNVAQILRGRTASRIVADLRPRSPRTKSRLLSISGVSRATFQPILRGIVEVGLAKQTRTGSYILGESFPGSSVEFCAFEFKLRDWQRAFYQALRYRAFAHRVYIVMPALRTVRAADQAARFRVFGLGLIEHDPTGRSRRLVRARKGAPRSRPSFVRGLADLAAEFV